MSTNNKMLDARVAVAAMLIAAGIVGVVVGTFKSGNYHDPMSPSFFPLLLAYLLFTCGAFLGGRAWLSRPAAPEPDDARHPRYGRGVLGAVVLVLYGFGVFYIGFWLASVLVILALGVLLLDGPVSTRFVWLVLTMGIVVPVVVAFMFDAFAGIKMPQMWGIG